jgi:hypothetical protein
VIDFIGRLRRSGLEAASAMLDVALWSSGAVSYSDVKRMSPEEFKMVSDRVIEHVKTRAKAGMMDG